MITDADSNTIVSKVSDIDDDTDTLVFTDHFYLQLVYIATYIIIHTINH